MTQIEGQPILDTSLIVDFDECRVRFYTRKHGLLYSIGVNLPKKHPGNHTEERLEYGRKGLSRVTWERVNKLVEEHPDISEVIVADREGYRLIPQTKST